MATLFELDPPPQSELRLNEAQRRAITHGEGPLLVIAGAGTGKTRVITERIRHLLQSDETLSGENILGLTFTNKAAGEMKARVVRATGERGKNVTLQTFHAFCESLLKEAMPERLMIDKVDHWILLRRNLERLRLDKYRRLADPGQFLNDFVEFFSRCQDELVSSEDYQRYADSLAAQLESERAALDEETYKERAEEVALQLEIARAYRASQELLREKKRVSFGSLITGAVELLETNADLRRALQEKYRYILVDEFQDTNIAQLRLLELLAGEKRNIVAVGDNDQAIYRFRGASFGSFKLFLERFAGWREGQDSTKFRVSLVENYRSTPNILRVATQVIAQNTVSADFPKKVLSANKEESEKIRIVEMETEEDEARWIALELQRLHAAGRKWRDFAVLYRQHAHRDELVEELSSHKIPFVISKLSILDHPLVKDVLSYMRLIAKPFDDIACARVLAAPAWGLDPADLVRLAERARKEKKALHDMLQAPQGQLAFDTSHAALPQLFEFLSDQRKTLRRPAREILADLLEWLEIAQRAGPQDRKYVTRLTEFAKEWEPKSETRGLAEFVEYLDYYSQAGGTISLEDDFPGDAVQLMTVHGAKGLEFPQVFLLRINNKKFPATERSRVFEFPAALMKEGEPAEQFHIQEERRLFYVALTRAENRLTLTTLTEKKGKIPVFIEDMLMDPAIKRRDVHQLSPKLPEITAPARKDSSNAAAAQLFPASAAPPKIFSRIADWALEFHPPTPEPLSLSPSAVSGYRNCPQQYLFSRSWSLKEGPKAVLSFGSVMHTTIKRFVDQLRKGVKLPFEEVARIFEMEWISAGFEDDYQEKGYKADGLEQLRAFLSALLEAPPQVLEQEKSFELPLENNVTIIGRMDQVNSLGRNEVEIVDYKTGKPKKDADAKKDLQLSLYTLAAKEIFEWNPVHLVFHYLQNNQIQVTTRDAKQLDEAQKIVLETAADIRAGEFPAKPGFICRNCTYRPICPAHEEALSS
ncbi:MAG TPA: UvrD-helicase domain-containing protein [Candidatus Solibacter sp.]|nr:UvrD-helicase domain-containing protein [Candidatus Solibacter sp.]